MQYVKRWMIAILVMGVGIQLTACSGAEYTKVEPIEIEDIEGSKYHKLTLTEQAIDRLDVQTVPLTEEMIDGVQRMVIPYAALLYDLEGHTFAYINTEPRTYLKESIEVDYIVGDKVVLIEGPQTGTEIVTVGVAELYGADTGVGQ